MPDNRRSFFQRTRFSKPQLIFVALEMGLILVIVGVITLSALDASATIRPTNTKPCGDNNYYYGTCIEPNAADLVGQFRVTPDREASTRSDTLITFSFRVQNIGQGKAEHLRFSLPIDPALVMGYSEFNDPKIWISSLNETEVVVSLPPLEREEEAIGTLVFRPKSDPVPVIGTRVTLRYIMKYDDPTGPVTRQSNAVTFTFAETSRDVSEGLLMLLVPDVLKVQTGKKATATGNFFIPEELVNVWYTGQDGSSVALGRGVAERDGSYKFDLDTTGFTPGSYQLVMYGNRSMVSGVASITISA